MGHHVVFAKDKPSYQNPCFTKYRIITLAFVFAHFRHYGISFVAALFFSNLGLALLILSKNGRVKTIWTSIAAIVAPACFVSVETIEIYKMSLASGPEERFVKFYICNVVNFVLWGVVATVSLNCLSAYDVIPFKEVNLAIATFGYPMQLPIMGLGSFFWVIFAMILTIVETVIEVCKYRNK